MLECILNNLPELAKIIKSCVGGKVMVNGTSRCENKWVWRSDRLLLCSSSDLLDCYIQLTDINRYRQSSRPRSSRLSPRKLSSRDPASSSTVLPVEIPRLRLHGNSMENDYRTQNVFKLDSTSKSTVTLYLISTFRAFTPTTVDCTSALLHPR